LDGPDEFFYGKLDDFRVYNRALSDVEIRNLYVAESFPVYTVKNGSWTDATAWSVNRIPASTDAVEIRHNINVPASTNALARTVTYQIAGKVNLGASAKLLLNTN
jgi:hypothetical protein